MKCYLLRVITLSIVFMINYLKSMWFKPKMIFYYTQFLWVKNWGMA